jgi:hypothetical protein
MSGQKEERTTADPDTQRGSSSMWWKMKEEKKETLASPIWIKEVNKRTFPDESPSSPMILGKDSGEGGIYSS